MKVPDLPYLRYTVEQGKEALENFKAVIADADRAEIYVDAIVGMEEMFCEYETAASLANCRFTLNTKDQFYQEEMAYYDEVSPIFSQMYVEYAKIMLACPFRSELVEKGLIDPRRFDKYEVLIKSFDDCIIEEAQIENSIVTEYSKFMAEMKFDFDGEEMPLSVLRGYLEDSDRSVRERACCAIGRGLEKNAERLDDIYDRLVKIRDKMARKMGYKNFVELGYYRMGRLDFDSDDISKFRENVVKSIVPISSRIKNEIASELGIDKVMFYDDSVYSSGEAPKPILNQSEIFEAAQEMYDDMDAEVGSFMASMQEADAFDVESRDGKWGGGYCTAFEKYKQPFILANFNGTASDIDVITHEFGHALAYRFGFESGDRELSIGGMETAECHSMSMEFFAWKYMDKFFGDSADKYRIRHLLDALTFIPYGTAVDEFQHIIYEDPNLTPEQRKGVWRDLEKKYRPYMSYEGIPYLEQGTRWQYQMHIYESPFYYIDYCLAQTVSIGFLVELQKDYISAFARYIDFVRAGGTKPFSVLVGEAGLKSPFDEGALDELAESVTLIVEGLKDHGSSEELDGQFVDVE